MAVCKLTKDLLRSTTCGYSLPEITDIYLANYEDILLTTLSENTDGGGTEVATISMNSSAKWYHIEPAKNSANFSDTLVSGQAGNKYRTSTVGFTIAGSYDGKMVDALDAFSLGRFVSVVKTAEGKYLMLGRLNPLEATDTANLQGQGADGTNGLVIALTGNETEAPLPLSDAAIKVVTGAAGD